MVMTAKLRKDGVSLNFFVVSCLEKSYRVNDICMEKYKLLKRHTTKVLVTC